MTTGLIVLLILCFASNIICWILLYENNKSIKNLNLNNLATQLESLQEDLSIKQVAVKEELLNEINLSKIRIESLENYSKHNNELFKTVLHGFDFIVQGCKKSIDNQEDGKTFIDSNQKENEKLVEAEMASS